MMEGQKAEQFKRLKKHEDDTLGFGKSLVKKAISKKATNTHVEFEKPKQIFKDQVIHWCQDIKHLPGFEKIKKVANKILIEDEINETEKQFIIKGQKEIILEKTDNGIICRCSSFKKNNYCKHFFAVLMFKIWRDWNTFYK